MAMYAVIGLGAKNFLLGVYETRAAAEKAVDGKSSLWTIFEQVTPREALLPSGATWREDLPTPLRWKKWDEERPEVGRKAVIVCNDGASATPEIIIDFDGKGTVHVLNGRDGFDLCGDDAYMRGSLWAYLPDDYVLAFTEEGA